MTFISRDSQEDTRVFHGPVINKSIRTFKFENGVGIRLKTRALPVCRGMKGVYTCVLGRVKSEGNGARFPWIVEIHWYWNYRDPAEKRIRLRRTVVVPAKENGTTALKTVGEEKTMALFPAATPERKPTP